MSNDALAALIQAALDRRTVDPPPRRPEANNPMRPVAQRPERRTRPTYSDPTGNEAIGNLTPKKRRKP